MSFKYPMSSRDKSRWTVGCDECRGPVKLIPDPGHCGTYRCPCRAWSMQEIKEARDGLEGTG